MQRIHDGPERAAILRLLRSAGAGPPDGRMFPLLPAAPEVAGGDYLAESPVGRVLADLARRRAITETFARRRGWTRVRRDVRPELGSGWCQGALAIGGDLEHGSGDYVGTPWVGWFEPPREVRMVAASHYLWSAYRGQCPGVDPEEFRQWRTEAIAESEGLSKEAVLADIEAARQRIADAEVSTLSWVDTTGVCQGCGHQVADLTNGDAWDYCVCPRVADMLGEDLPASLGPAVAEASARFGQECLFELSQQGRRLIVCQGRPDTIRAFVEVWGPHRGLRDLCGNAALGVAQGRATE